MIHAWTAQRMRRRRWSCVHSAHIKLMRPRCLGIPVSTVAGSTSFLQVRQVLLFYPCQGHPKFWVTLGLLRCMGKICKCKTIDLLNATMKTFQYSWKRSSLIKYVYPVDWREMIKIAAFIWRQSYVSYQWVISDSSVFHKYYMRLFTYSVRDTYANIYFFSDFQWYLGVTSVKHASYVC